MSDDTTTFSTGSVWEECGSVVIVIYDDEGGYYEMMIDWDDLERMGFSYVPEGC